MHSKSALIVALILLGLIAGPAALAVERIKVVGLFKDMAIVNIDGQQRTLRAGETSPEGVTLISADSSEAVLEINGEQKSFGLDTQISGVFEGPAGGNIVRVLPDANGMYRINGNINGFSVTFIVDTGATMVVMNSREARRLGINYRLEGREGLAQTASGISKIYMVELDRVRVGEIEVRNVAGSVHEGEHPPQVLLGNSFLNELNLKRDGKVLELHETRR